MSKAKKSFKLTDSNLLFIITVVIFFAMYAAAMAFLGHGFLKPQTFFDILRENSGLIILSCGLSVVMITGGIDISVGGITCLVCAACAVYLNKSPDTNIFVALLIGLAVGLAFGIFQGFLVAYFEIQPFIITLAGMFLARGLATILNNSSINISHPKFMELKDTRIMIPFVGSHLKNGKWVNAYVDIGVIVAVLCVIILFVVLKWTKVGRNFYAVGGNAQSAMMLGINVKRTRFISHILSGFLAGLGGLMYFLYTAASSPTKAEGMEMDAIASSIIGGTLLTGGVGNIAGTLFGVLSLSSIKKIVTSMGFDDPWWTGVTVAAMLCLFLIIQSIVMARKAKA